MVLCRFARDAMDAAVTRHCKYHTYLLSTNLSMSSVVVQTQLICYG